MTTKISEAKFEALKSKLRELFELDKSDLDFGIYRIMAAKNTEITAFLDRHLKETVREVLESRGSDESTKLASEIAKAREAATTAGFNPDDSPRVKELEEQYAKLGGGSTEELEADIYNHLLNFFSRYYDEGDFISKRFYKGDTYAIPYSGEEVTLHWANKDQYYIKSGEWHNDYRFRVDDYLVHFRLIEASAETGNNKEPDESKRRYILALNNPVAVNESGKIITLHFEFRTPSEADEIRVEETAATRIFGGNFDKASGRTKGDQREGYCADAERRALASLSGSLVSLLSKPSPTPSKPNRTVLGKHLDFFTARNTFDYFIHKNLGGFLRRELDFYIKNEVVRLDDFLGTRNERLDRVSACVLGVRQVASTVIDLLHGLESFQKKLWCKKKFVLEANYCMSMGLVDDSHKKSFALSDSQRREWIDLYGIDEFESDLVTASYSDPLSLDFLIQNSSLIGDTRHLTQSEKISLLSTFEDIDAKLEGLLIQAENYHAMRLISGCFARKVNAVYIDPPYNTKKDRFPYKDEYKHASWLAMIQDRLYLLKEMLCETGVLFSSIDSNELNRFSLILERVFGESNRVGDIVWRNARDNNPTQIASEHEFVVCYAKDKQQTSQVWKNSFADAKEILQAEFDRLKNLGLTSNELQANLRAFIRDNAEVLGEVDRYKFVDDDGVYTGSQSVHNPHPGGYEYEVLHDVTLKPMRMPSNGYRFPYQTFKRDYIDAGRLIYGPDENRIVQIKLYLKDYKDSLRSVIDLDGRLGTYALNSLFGTGSDLFDNPKPPQLLRRILSFSGVPDSVVLDCFAGSGATVEAVHDIVRLAGVQMKYILVEMAAYFDTVLLPRTKKVAYSANWKNGRPQGSNDSLHFFKYFRLESYEDVLNNLPSPDGKLFEAMDQAIRDSLITYSLDLELGPHLLNMDAFKDPWGYKIYAQLAGEDEVSLHNVDMVETFNYLIGLKVQAYGPIERYSADFVRLPHGDDKDDKGTPLPEDKREGRLRVEGRLRRDAEGPFVYQRIEGELNDGNATRVLVIWRKLTDNAEKDAAVLEAWMARHRESTKERSDYREYHLIYLNGPITLPQPTRELRTVLPTEQTFKDRMFEDTKV